MASNTFLDDFSVYKRKEKVTVAIQIKVYKKGYVRKILSGRCNRGVSFFNL